VYSRRDKRMIFFMESSSALLIQEFTYCSSWPCPKEAFVDGDGIFGGDRLQLPVVGHLRLNPCYRSWGSPLFLKEYGSPTCVFKILKDRSNGNGGCGSIWGELIWIAEEDRFLDLIIMVDERGEMYPEF
jgi:hypothetical protein